MIKLIQLLLIISSTLSAQSLIKGERFITTSDSVRLYVKVAGKGEPCIFIHGGPGAWSYNFEALGGNKLEDTLTMIYYDQRGSGRSESAHHGDYSLKRMVMDIDEIRTALGLQKTLIMSHSFGGIIAINYVNKFLENTSAFILLNSTLDLSYSMESIIENGIKVLGLTDTAKYFDSSVPLQDRFGMIAQKLNEQNAFFKLQFESKDALDKVDSVDAFNKSDFDFGKKVWNYPEYYENYSPLTVNVTVPVLVIAGLKDKAVGPDHYKSFRFPNQTNCLIDSKHIIYLEKNKEFVECIKNFLHKIL